MDNNFSIPYDGAMKWLMGIGAVVLVGWYVIQPANVPETNVAKPVTADPPALTLEEKIGLLFIVGHWANTPVEQTNSLIRDHHLGGVIVMSAPEVAEEIKNWTNAWQQHRELPVMIAIDQEGGLVTRLKGKQFTQTAQPEIATVDQAFAVGVARGAELSTLGVNTNFAPVLERSLNPDSFLYDRVFREPSLIPDLASALINGQREGGVISVVKHYPGHADEPTDSHVELPEVLVGNETYEQHVQPFHQLIEQDEVDALMTAHVLLPNLDPTYPATLSKTILTEKLREETGFAGVIITDDMSMDAIDTRYSTSEAALLSLQAGADMVLFAAEPHLISEAIERIRRAIEAGELSEQEIDEKITRIQTLLERL